MTLISNSGHDERGRYNGGVAGDQTGSEWHVINWYRRPWNVVFRYPDKKVADLIAEYSKHAANNNKIGYDQYQRTTFWDYLKNAKDYDPANIKTACEADCSAGVAAIVKAVGYKLGIQKLKDVNINMWTGNETAVLKGAGFKAMYDSKYTAQDDYLFPGDILCNTSCHTAINVTAGGKSGYISYAKEQAAKDAEKKKQQEQAAKQAEQKKQQASWKPNLSVDGSVGSKTVKTWQHVLTGKDGDGILNGQNKANKKYHANVASIKYGSGGDSFVKAIQKAVGVTQNGQLNATTIKAVQKRLGVAADGYFGPKTAKALQKKLNTGKF